MERIWTIGRPSTNTDEKKSSDILLREDLNVQCALYSSEIKKKVDIEEEDKNANEISPMLKSNGSFEHVHSDTDLYSKSKEKIDSFGII